MLFHYQRTDAAVSACTDYRLNVNDVRELKNFQRFLENIGFSLTISWNTECFCFICHIFLPFKRKRTVSLYFGRNVCTRLGVAISEVSGPPVFHIKVGVSRYVPCPRTQQANLPACSPQPPLNAERQTRKLQIPFFKVFWHDSTRGLNPRSTDCEADALTTTPSRRLRRKTFL